jgi:hypothetical protein
MEPASDAVAGDAGRLDQGALQAHRRVEGGLMFPQGFLGTRADLLMDIVIVALVAVVPIVLYNWQLARRGQYARHKTLQISLALLLAAVVGLFEVNLRLQGGICCDQRECLCRNADARLLDLPPHLLRRDHAVSLDGPDPRLAAPVSEPASTRGFQRASQVMGASGNDLDAGDWCNPLPVYFYGFAS